MKPQTIVFVGRSGAGKGTQLELLKKYITEQTPSIIVNSIGMGDIYRTFFSHDGYIQNIAKETTMNQGKFQPDFLTNALFITHAVNVVDKDSHIFIEGYPRSMGQLDTLKQLMAFAGRENMTVINVEVPREEVKKRMLARGRGDDSDEKIDSRLSEYDRTVVPLIDMIKQDATVKYIEIDGTPAPEVIHTNIISTLFS